MEIFITQIKKVDLKKLLKNKGMSLYKLSKLSKVDHGYLRRADKGYVRLSEEAWNKIKFYL